MSDNLKEQILERASECWSEDGTNFYTGMLADKILQIPEIAEALQLRALIIAQQGKSVADAILEVQKMKPIQTMKVREDWPTTFIDKREEWELRRK